jgi:protein CpxP
MIDNDNLPMLPESFFRAPPRKEGGKRLLGWPRVIVFAVVMGCGLGVAAADFAASAAAMDHLGWRQGARLAMIQHVVAHALDSVGASAEQEAKAHDIVAAKFAEVSSDLDQREALRKQALGLLGAPTVDRVAVEKLRSEAIAGIEAKSKIVVSGLLDIADVLTPAQRAQLAEEIERWRPKGDGPMGGPDKD